MLGTGPSVPAISFSALTEKTLLSQLLTILYEIKRMTTLLCTASRTSSSFAPLLRLLSLPGNGFRTGNLIFHHGRLQQHQKRGYLVLQTVLNPRSVSLLYPILSFSDDLSSTPILCLFFCCIKFFMMNTLSLYPAHSDVTL